MDRTYYLIASTPANTPVATPVSTSFPLEDNILKSVTVDIPDGHCGLTGIRILRAQQQIFPWANNSWFIANDYHKDYPFEDEMTGTGIVIQSYNTDIFVHKFYITAIIADLPIPTEVPTPESAPVVNVTGTPISGTDYLSTDFLYQPGPTIGDTTIPGAPVPVIVPPISIHVPAKKTPKPKPVTHKRKPPIVRSK